MSNATARNVLALILIAGVPGFGAAQSVRVTPVAGITRPLAGEMTMWLPIPVMSGFDSVAYKHSYDPGTTFGVLAEFNRAGWLGFAAQATVNFATRQIVGEDGQDRTCDCKESVIYGVGALATASNRVGERTRLYAGLGPEALYFSGSAVSNSDGFPPPQKLEISPRLLLGALGTLGLESDVTSRFSMRLHGAFRYYAPNYEAEDQSMASWVTYSTKAHTDLLVTLGFTFRPAVPPR
jgi:hypothetical protein